MFTAEQENQMIAFIGKCTLANVTLAEVAKLGINRSYTVQDLVHLPAEILRKVGKGVETANKEHGGSAFEKSSQLEIPANSGITATEWINFLQLCITRKDWLNRQREKEQELEQLRKELTVLETPRERKAKIQERINELVNV
jgi:hypothetical protein